MDPRIFELNKMQMTYDGAKQWLEYCDGIDRLLKNPDFQLLLDVFTRHEVVRLTSVLTDNNVTMSDHKEQIIANVLDDLKASSTFRNYIYVAVPRIRSMAIKALEDIKEQEDKNS